MKFSRRIGLFLVTGLVVGMSVAQADQGVSTAGILGQLHSNNVREMRMGTMAVQHGMSKDVRDYGQLLIADHETADTLVASFAKSQNITLASNTPPVGPMDVPMGERFDAAFAKTMLVEHKKALADLQYAYDRTRNEKLKVILNAIKPMLEKHEAIAQHLVDQSPKS